MKKKRALIEIILETNDGREIAAHSTTASYARQLLAIHIVNEFVYGEWREETHIAPQHIKDSARALADCPRGTFYGNTRSIEKHSAYCYTVHCLTDSTDGSRRTYYARNRGER